MIPRLTMLGVLAVALTGCTGVSPAGAPPAYKFGVAHLYESLGVPCLPVALNSGLFWPRRAFTHRKGTIVSDRHIL